MVVPTGVLIRYDEMQKRATCYSAEYSVSASLIVWLVIWRPAILQLCAQLHLHYLTPMNKSEGTLFWHKPLCFSHLMKTN